MSARLLFFAALLCFSIEKVSAQTDSDITLLDPFAVVAEEDSDFDPTGMGGPEAEMNEPPFSNDLLAGQPSGDEAADEITSELQLVSGASPADLATAVNRVNLRGFPTPRLRNGFSQIGIPEVLAVDRVEVLQGPLTPVAGRAAPGGIQNFVTYRPRGREQTRLQLGANDHDEEFARAETHLLLRPKKVWSRFAVGWQSRQGPETFARLESRTASGAVTIRHSARASTMFMMDYSELAGNPAPNIPEYRETASGKILGPYRPLAFFHTYGPNAGIERRSFNASAQFEAQLTRKISLRANLQSWQRTLTEDRFTYGQYLLDVGRFGGVREPQHISQPQRALSGGIETTARYTAFGIDHKASLLIESNRTRYQREHRALPFSERNRLPASVRFFDPDTPDYSRPAFDPDVYSRLITDRLEEADFTSISLSQRSAFWRGRLVTTLGGRLDFVGLELHDRRSNATRPFLADHEREITYHAGANYQLRPGKLLVFANTSTAFEPSTRVDARTGRIQGNETTLGFETGLKGLFLERRLSATVLFFRFLNQNISRRNPLYEDPIADAAQTQPQLVAAGEERFTGGTLDLKASVAANWTLSGRATVTEAITTRSPDLPEEIGRELTRLPRTTLGLTNRFTLTGRLTGWQVTTTLTYVSDFVAHYENATRAYLAYPSNTLVGLTTGYSWKTGSKTKARSHSANLSVRNLLDRDQLATFARAGQDRQLGVGYTLTF